MIGAKHTPGPWDWDAGDIGHESSHPYCQVFVDGGNLIIADVNDRFDREEGHANAHLMSKAWAIPMLEEALKEYLDWHESQFMLPSGNFEDPDQHELARNARTALALLQERKGK